MYKIFLLLVIRKVEKTPFSVIEKQYKMFEPEKNNDFEHKNAILEPVRTAWLAIANEVRTRIIGSDRDIFIPELSF